MSEKRIFENHQPYHIFTRGIDGRIIFFDEADYYRFIFLFYACNFGSPAFNLWKKDIVKAGKAILQGEKPPPKFIQKEHKQLVDVLSLTLIPNHYHSILEQLVRRGISIFMQKVNGGYGKYFNFKYQREGRLFQGPFKSILIDNENYLLRVSRYVHLNVLDLIQSDWRKEGVKNPQKAIKFLSEYPWSTTPDYLGVRNSKIVTTKGLYNIFFENFSKRGVENYKRFLLNWSQKDSKELQSLFLE